MLRWSILCKPAYLHELPFCNNACRCGSPYVDKTCIIHTWIQSGHMIMCAHASPESAYVCDMHDTCVALKFWVTWSKEERILLPQRSKIQKLLEHAPGFPVWVAFGNYLVSESAVAATKVVLFFKVQLRLLWPLHFCLFPMNLFVQKWPN